MPNLTFAEICRGDTVTFVTPHGNRITGKAVMFNRQTKCWVLNCGGAHGTPGLADVDNTCTVRRPKTWACG